MSFRRCLPVLTLSLLSFLAAVSLLTVSSDRPVAAPPKEKAEPKPAPAISECRWTANPIVLDGKDDEPAWKEAQAIKNFGQPWLKDKQAKLRGSTVAKLLWDREYLYFHADMGDVDLFADITKHDGDIWENDAFELFFKPAADKAGYYEFEVNAANAILDAFYPERRFDNIIEMFKKGEFRLETKVALRGTLNERNDVDRGWSVEGRIPWADFLRTGGRPEPGEQWLFSLCRCNYDKDQPIEVASISPHVERRMGPFFHQFEDYNLLKFIGPSDMPGMKHGLAKRVPLTTSTVVGSPEPPLPYRKKRLYPNFSPMYPILAKPIPGTDQLLVVSEDQPWGHSIVSRVKDDQAVKTADMVELFNTPDRGLVYDACFHPNFAENHYLYLGWCGDIRNGKRKSKSCRITRYTLQLEPTVTIDKKSAKTILEWESDGHNGLAMAFGLDGMMLVTSGDGSSDSDTDETGQTTDTYLSKLMRIDVDHPTDDKPYSIPSDNPYVNDKRFIPETYAYGFRNPWRMTVDAKTGHIWVGQNGQDLFEQAYLVTKGANYGWSVNEGSHPFYTQRKRGPHPITMPTIEHPHAEFRSLTGGIVLYGQQFPELDGTFLYGDYSTGRIWGMKHDGTKVISHRELASPRLQVTNFAQNHQGDLIICDHSPSGGLYTFERTPTQTQEVPFPRKLSESGLFDSVPDHKLKPGVVPYAVNAEFWSDGMHKERFIAIPGTGTISMTKSRGWNFPDKTVIVKSFALEQEEGNSATRKWIETRFMTKQEGEWYGYTYRWNEAGTDADLIPAGGRDEKFTVKTAQGDRAQVWHYPSRAECMACHSRAANYVLGLCSLQMNKEHNYGHCTENQLQALEHAGILRGFDWSGEASAQLNQRAKGLSGKELKEYIEINGQQKDQRQARSASLMTTHSSAIPRLVNPYDRKEDLTTRARSWLHANCSACHVPAGGGNAQMDLDFGMSVGGLNIVDVKPVHSTLGIPDAKLVARGAPERSVLLKRISTRGPNQMPQLSTNRVDDKGVALIREWIESLKQK